MHDAMSLISQKAGPTINASPVYESPSWGFEHPNNFLNQVIETDTKLSPSELLKTLHSIEQALGRTESRSDDYEARTIDIDILFYDKMTLSQDDLIIPHPRLHLRRFTLEPMAALNPGYFHPVLNKSIQELLNECPDDSPVAILDQNDEPLKVEEVGNAS